MGLHLGDQRIVQRDAGEPRVGVPAREAVGAGGLAIDQVQYVSSYTDNTIADQGLVSYAKTIPVEFGLRGSIRLMAASLLLAVGMSIVLFWMTPYRLGYPYLAGSLLAGIFLLLLPAYRLHKGESPGEAIALFNRASNYPVVMLFVVMISW